MQSTSTNLIHSLKTHCFDCVKQSYRLRVVFYFREFCSLDTNSIESLMSRPNRCHKNVWIYYYYYYYYYMRVAIMSDCLIYTMALTKNHSKHDQYDSINFQALLWRKFCKARKARSNPLLFPLLCTQRRRYSNPASTIPWTRKKPRYIPLGQPRSLRYHGFPPVAGSSNDTSWLEPYLFHNDTRGLRAGKADSAQNGFRFRPCATSLRGWLFGIG